MKTETNYSKGVNSVLAVRDLMTYYGMKSDVMPTNSGNGSKSPFDLLIGGKVRVEVKASPGQADGRWLFNVHRHGVLDESKVDFYVLRLENVPQFKYAIHLVIPAPIGRFSIVISLRSLITKYAKHYNRFDLIKQAAK